MCRNWAFSVKNTRRFAGHGSRNKYRRRSSIQTLRSRGRPSYARIFIQQGTRLTFQLKHFALCVTRSQLSSSYTNVFIDSAWILWYHVSSMDVLGGWSGYLVISPWPRQMGSAPQVPKQGELGHSVGKEGRQSVFPWLQNEQGTRQSDLIES